MGQNEAQLLQVNHLTTSFKTERGWLKAVDGVSFSITQGEILGVVGESGCGKSVTSQSILRLYDEKKLTRYGGQVLFQGTNLFSLPQRTMQRYRGKMISMVFQDALSALNPVFTVGEQIM
ncbi:MAG: ATP-binding cassette domain-containing protein, partial [Sphaerochaeta sp.]|nr:ATP-binding cassette domain-containing protein [Sphaerochaeta sp.]